ncbi:MAG: nucleotidyl transferase AbiEii/AbiGii toxin family protein [Bacteroidota bacterium]
MDDQNADKAPESRPPSTDDLVFLCRKLNEAGARYIVIGGMAILHAGFSRATEDIDLLLDDSNENLGRVRKALMHLPDQAITDLKEGELQQYQVVRIADEFVVDLMLKACGVNFKEAEPQIEFTKLDGVRIPFASPELLWRLKQSMREKDKLDRIFLSELLRKNS